MPVGTAVGTAVGDGKASVTTLPLAVLPARLPRAPFVGRDGFGRGFVGRALVGRGFAAARRSLPLVGFRLLGRRFMGFRPFVCRLAVAGCAAISCLWSGSAIIARG